MFPYFLLNPHVIKGFHISQILFADKGETGGDGIGGKERGREGARGEGMGWDGV